MHLQVPAEEDKKKPMSVAKETQIYKHFQLGLFRRRHHPCINTCCSLLSGTMLSELPMLFSLIWVLSVSTRTFVVSHNYELKTMISIPWRGGSSCIVKVLYFLNKIIQLEKSAGPSSVRKNLFVLRPWLNYPFRALRWIISMCLEHKWFAAARHYSIDFMTSPCSHILSGVPCQRVREFRAKLATTIKHVKAYVHYAVYMCALVIPHHQPLESATPPPPVMEVYVTTSFCSISVYI